jgi:hypothetical protein
VEGQGLVDSPLVYDLRWRLELFSEEAWTDASVVSVLGYGI